MKGLRTPFGGGPMIHKVICILALFSQPVLAAVKSIHKTPYIRFSGTVKNPQINRQNTFLAFTEDEGSKLKIVNLKSKEVFHISSQNVSNSFFWAPNGFRLFYREMYREKGEVISEIKAYDVPISKSLSIDKIKGWSGSLSFDPRDYRFYAYHPKGIRKHQIKYPGQRLAKWQIAQKNKMGYWLSTKRNILWVSNNGITMRKINSNKNKISSFDISPDGKSIVWADQKENIYLAKEGREAKLISRGLDPKWHPKDDLILYAHARILGNKIIDHDIRIMDRMGHGRYLTKSMSVNERYPLWLEKSSSVLYTHSTGTDIYEMSFKL